MDLDKLKISIPYEQPIEIIIEFPIDILSEYNGPSDLDVTWDDNIMYFINDSLVNNGIHIKQSQLEIGERTLSYSLVLVAKPPILDLSCIVDRLIKENFQKGLAIKQNTKYNNSMKLF